VKIINIKNVTELPDEYLHLRGNESVETATKMYRAKFGHNPRVMYVLPQSKNALYYFGIHDTASNIVKD